jgi:Arc/MetJ-type ribon-helix-helix transcriptional regulator
MSKAPSAKSSRVTIKIPRPLYERLQAMIEGTGFSSVTDFVVYVLRDLSVGGKLTDQESDLSPTEVELIRRRLRSLGYL